MTLKERLALAREIAARTEPQFVIDDSKDTSFGAFGLRRSRREARPPLRGSLSGLRRLRLIAVYCGHRG